MNLFKSVLGRIASAREAEVTVCIPAWQAEPFIDRTLGCARKQTHSRLRILVSIDASDDATAEICQAHAELDPRITVFVQKERLGWAGNVNFLLNKAESEFFYLYFHDDIIEPTFTTRLVAVLKARPDAASARCDMGLFGARAKVKPSRNYDGSAAERLCLFLVATNRGSLLRSMMRREALGDLRLPNDGPAGFWANEPYLMGLVSAGPALRVGEVLYKRWDKREGGLTNGWLRLSREEMRLGLRAITAAALTIVNGVPASNAEREVLRFCVFLFMIGKARGVEQATAIELFRSPADLNEAFADILPPSGLEAIGPQIRDFAMARFVKIDAWATAGMAS